MIAAQAKGHVRQLVTPDGVPLNLVIADYGERCAAVVIDLMIIIGSFIALGLVSATVIAGVSGIAATIFLLIAFFFLRSFYFILFEIRWHGATPGKRAIGLRVIDRNGGRLRPEAIFGRNLMREVELYIPITFYFYSGAVGIESVWLLLNTIWLGIFVLLPLFNKDRMRAGDMVGGTLVIHVPKVELLQDVASTGTYAPGTAGGEPGRRFKFRADQLAIYGIHELQVLEKILRQEGKDAADIFHKVADQIAKKIGWAGEDFTDAPERFLREFYAAQRKSLEGGLLFGKRKKDKYDGPPPTTATSHLTAEPRDPAELRPQRRSRRSRRSGRR